jgi:hypothetical protein
MSKSKDGKTKRVKVHISPELAKALGDGDDLDATVEAILTAHLEKREDSFGAAKDKVRKFVEDVAGPHMPQLEAVAKDVAAKVAKDVATAAFTAWAASAARPKASPAANDPKDGGNLTPQPKAGSPDA